MPMLSVLIPTYNDAKYIRQSLDSILTQSYKDFELVIVNDASTDDTDEIVRTYLHDLRIKYFINEKNLGVAKALNVACRKATGKYVCGISSDDWINRGFFELGINALLQNSNIPICFFDVTNFKNGKFFKTTMIPNTKKQTVLNSHDMWKIHKKYNFCIPAATAIVEKNELEKRGFFSEEVGYFCDVVALTPIALEKGCIYIPKVGSFFRQLDKDESRHANKTRKDLIKEKENILIYLRKNKKLFNQLCYSTALPRYIHYSLYTIFLKPKFWDIAIPMIFVKFKLMFTKLIRKYRHK